MPRSSSRNKYAADNYPKWDPNELLHHAEEARKNAHCVYSNYPVGSAILMNDGTVIPGCNVENVSYGLSMCAERNAISQALSKGYSNGQFLGIAVTIGNDKVANCCGACRQLMSEIANENFFCVFIGDPKKKNSPPICKRVNELLPSLALMNDTGRPDWDVDELLNHARRAMEKSYLQRFDHRGEVENDRKRAVGCAIRIEIADSNIKTKEKEVLFHTASVFEARSMQLSMCAERIACGKAISRGIDLYKHPEFFVGIAICSEDPGYVPCGATLQILAEFATDDLFIILPDQICRLSDLLPGVVPPSEVLRKAKSAPNSDSNNNTNHSVNPVKKLSRPKSCLGC